MAKAKLVEYDPLVLKGYADRLYQEARVVALFTAMRYLGIMAIFSLLPVWILHVTGPLREEQAYSSAIGFSVFLIIVAAMVGAAIGADRAFHMKLEAQQVLCQVAIEANTRGATQPTNNPAAVHTD